MTINRYNYAFVDNADFFRRTTKFSCNMKLLTS